VAVTGLLLGAAFAIGRRRQPRAAIAVSLVVAAVALVAATIAASAAPAATTSGTGVSASGAARSAPVQPSYPGRPDYLALGDSVAFGYRPVNSAATYLNPANFTGYPEDVAKALQLNLANASCPGETTSSMINTGAPSNGCETNAGGSPGYRSLVPPARVLQRLAAQLRGAMPAAASDYQTRDHRHRRQRRIPVPGQGPVHGP
jgi:hypothetical protein